MTCAYLIQSHTNPAQLLRLVRTIRRGSPRAPVLVVHDATRCELDQAAFRGTGGVRVLSRRLPVERGGFSMVDSLLEGLRLLLGEAPGERAWDFDWLAYLSGQDYPARPTRQFEASLGAGGVDGYLRSWGIDGTDPASPWHPRQGRIRYLAQYARWPEPSRPLALLLRPLRELTPLRVHRTYGLRVGWRPRRTPFDGPLRCYGGRQWWTLSRPCAEAVLGFERRHPEAARWFRRTVAPDEAYVQTALRNDPRFRLHPDDRRYVDFRGSRDGRPRFLTMDDFKVLTSGSYDFARKFDAARDPELLDRIDAEVLAAR